MTLEAMVDTRGMFEHTGYSSQVFTLDLGDKFDTSKVKDMRKMFSGTGYSNPSFTLNLGSKFDTSNVTSMMAMFYDTGHNNDYFELDLSTFDFSKVTNYFNMLYTWKSTQKIWVKDANDQNWIITNGGSSNLTTSNVLIKT